MELESLREIRKRDNQICCPFCGKVQFRLKEGSASFTCDRCKSVVAVVIKDGMLMMDGEVAVPCTDVNSR